MKVHFNIHPHPHPHLHPHYTHTLTHIAGAAGQLFEVIVVCSIAIQLGLDALITLAILVFITAVVAEAQGIAVHAYAARNLRGKVCESDVCMLGEVAQCVLIPGRCNRWYKVEVEGMRAVACVWCACILLLHVHDLQRGHRGGGGIVDWEGCAENGQGGKERDHYEYGQPELHTGTTCVTCGSCDLTSSCSPARRYIWFQPTLATFNPALCHSPCTQS